MKYYLGIDLGGTGIKAGLVDEEYKIIQTKSIPTGAERPAVEVVEDMAQLGKDLLHEAGLSEDSIEFVGIGVPSTVNGNNQHIVFANNLGWKDYDFVSDFHKFWDIPVYLGNDADVAAVAEMKAGIGKDYKNALFLTLGTGVGGGLIFDGKLYGGGDGFGCEPGHTMIMVDGEQCTCGKKGCFEAYASVTALIRDAKRAMAEHPETSLHKLAEENNGEVNGRLIFGACNQGDPVAKELIKNYVHYLSVGIGSMITLLRPEIVMIGGGVANAGDTIFVPLREELKNTVYAQDVIGIPPVVHASLGNDAGIIGAALLGLKED